MIKTADEFITLRQSDNMDEQYRAGHDTSEISVWLEVIKNYPDFKTWVIHNKTIQIEILEILCSDDNPKVRADVAGKRKINDKIFDLLSVDSDENVRYALMCNTKLTLDKKQTIKMDDSPWLTKKFADMVKNAST
ncbi:MAG: HEAT repeat domain-containing protein [Bacteroidia bacterium]|nr:HEAT repeat domain-containing protein [Bacteroidia bacterium]